MSMDDKKSNNRPIHNFTEVRRLTDSKFLNLYEMDALTHSGKPFNYYFASRKRDENIRIRTGGTKPEGMCVYAIKKDDPGKLLMVNQYRFPIDMYIYEVPAGLIEEGETPREAAVREIKEETGLSFTPYEKDNLVAERPYVFAPGFSDEMGVTVYGTVTGEFSKALQEDSEYIEALFVDREEAGRILKEEVLSMRAQMLLMQFIHSDDEAPFKFLTVE